MNNLDHYTANKEEFDFWVNQHVNGQTPKLEVSNDIFQPLIAPFVKANPTVNIYGCKECVLDMLVWTKAQLKKK